MKYVIRLLGGNFEHWRVLHALARRQIRAGISAWATRGVGRLRNKRGATVFFYIFLVAMGVNTNALVSSSLFAPIELGLITSTWITYQVTSLFCLFLLTTTFRELFVSNDDYNNLCFRPVDSKSYFLSKLSAMLLQVFIITGIMTLPVTMANLSTYQFVGVLTFVLSNFLLQITVATLALSLFVSLTNHSFSKGKTSKVSIVSYLLMYGMLIPTSIWYLLPKIRTGEFPTQYPVWAEMFNPFTWYASIPALASGSVSFWTILGTFLAVTTSIFVYVYLQRYANLELSIKVQQNYDSVTTSEDFERPQRALASILSFESSPRRQSAPMWLLFRAHLRANKKFRGTALGVLVVPILLSVTPIILDLIGIGESASEAIQNGPPQMMYAFILMYCLLMTNLLLLSSEFRASWVLFTAPVRLKDLCAFSDRLVRYYLCIPYVIILFAVILAYGMTSSVWDAFSQVLLFALVLNGVVMLKSGIQASVPFSQGPEIMGKFLGQFVVIFVCMLLASACGYLIPLCTETVQVFLASAGVLLLANVCARLFYRWRIARRERRLEFVV